MTAKKTVKKSVKKRAAKKVPAKIYDTKTILLKLVESIELSQATDSQRGCILEGVKAELNK